MSLISNHINYVEFKAKDLERIKEKSGGLELTDKMKNDFLKVLLCNLPSRNSAG